VRQIIGLWIFSIMVHLLSWDREKAAIRENIRKYYNTVITQRFVSRYQMIVLMVKTSSVTLLCMLIAELFDHFAR